MSVRTRAQLNSDADSAIPDNTVGEVSPADVRQRIKDLADSSKLAEDIATFAQFNSAAAGKLLANDSVWASLVSLTDGATIALDFDTGYDFAVILGGNRTLGAPTNARSGKKGIVWASATGAARTLTLNAAWVLATGVEAGPYSITTSQVLGIAYAIRGTIIVVTGIVRTG
jgi:hypothetical protein